MSAVECEWFAVRSLREFLALRLPARVTTVNSARLATLKTPTAGPFTITAGAETLVVSFANRDAADYTITLTTGSRTSTQIVTDLSATLGPLATVDSSDRVVLTSDIGPVGAFPSIVSVSSAGTANSSLGWATGGEYDERSLIQAPTYDGIMDGEPLQPDPSLFRAGGLIIMFDDRSSTPRSQNVRDDMYWVDLDVALFFIEPNQYLHRNREPIHACLRAVRECLLTDLGRAGGGVQPSTSQAIVKVIEKSARVGGRSITLTGQNLPNALMDVAQIKLGVLVFERPDSS